MGRLTEENLKTLVKEAEAAKERGESLVNVFNSTADKTGMAAGSVRNAYYACLKKAETDPLYAEKMGAGSLKAAKIVEFEVAEARSLLKKILVGATSGKSVRRVISEIAPDEKTALRYQNKYRNMIKNDKDAVESVRQEIIKAEGRCFDPYSKADGDETYEKLKQGINALYARISAHVRKENADLKRKIEELKRENERLKSSAAKRKIEGLAVKNYFEDFALSDVGKDNTNRS